MNQIDNQQSFIIYHTADGKAAVSLYARDGNVWMNQNQLAELFDTSKQNISLHIANILKEKELPEVSTVKDYLTVASNDKQYNITFYSLDMAIAHLKEYLIKAIKKVATHFRTAIEACPRSSLLDRFENFPKNSCGDASLLLGAYLEEKGFGEFIYMLGSQHEEEQVCDHAWIEQEGIIVDITADQFSEINDKVIVTDCSTWHARFRLVEALGQAHFKICSEENKYRFENAYKNILSRVD